MRQSLARNLFGLSRRLPKACLSAAGLKPPPSTVSANDAAR